MVATSVANDRTGLSYTHDFLDAPYKDRDLLGGKGAGLASMARLGLPVPPGFVITTECGRDYLASGALPNGVLDEVRRRIDRLEEESGLGFGTGGNPLLVSVRSGAPVSMPGMMDTILNCGLTAAGAAMLEKQTGDARFAYSSFERLLRSFAVTVRQIPEMDVEERLPPVPTQGPTAKQHRARCAVLEELIAERGEPFPDAWGQLEEAIGAVFRSWNSPRAQAYRKFKGLPDTMGTAVVVQRMVFGNQGAGSCSGVAFTRNPSTGSNEPFGEVLFDAQGEDVVDGSHDAEPLDALDRRLPAARELLDDVMHVLEREYRDMCDIEFTVERGRLWILQTRVGQRSGRAAVRLAVAMHDEGLITREEALERVSAEQLASARASVLAPADGHEVLARGLAACPGAGVGPAVFDQSRCAEFVGAGTRPVLIRPTTSPADTPGLIESVAVVTGRGGRTSHAAVVARGLGRPAVCGVGVVAVGDDGRSARIGGVLLAEGETVSVDGDRGLLVRGAVPLLDAAAEPAVARFLDWSTPPA